MMDTGFQFRGVNDRHRPFFIAETPKSKPLHWFMLQAYCISFMKKSLISKTIGSFSFGAVALAVLCASLQAETYVAKLTGVECEGCKKTIAKSLANINGVETIQIKKVAEKEHLMTVTTDGSKPISMDEAAAAIKHAEHYKIQSWNISSEAQVTTTAKPTEEAKKTTPTPAPVKSTVESWLTPNGWDNIVGTWSETDGPTITFSWKYPGKVLESAVKWGESERFSIIWQHPTSGEISIVSLDNKGGQSIGTCEFGADKAIVKENYAVKDGRTGEKISAYTLSGDSLTLKVNEGEPRTLTRNK